MVPRYIEKAVRDIRNIASFLLKTLIFSPELCFE